MGMRVDWKWPLIGIIIGIILATIFAKTVLAIEPQTIETRIDTSTRVQEKTQSLEDYGQLQIAIFKDQSVAAETPVKINNKSTYFTDAQGLLFLHLPSGTHEAVIYPDNEKERKSFKFSIVSNETTQALITLIDEKKDFELELQSPQAKVSDVKIDSKDLVTISGTIKNLENNQAIAGARLFVRGKPFEAQTDKDGKYLLKLPKGAHDISVIHRKFSTQTIKGLVVKNKATTQDFKLSPSGLELEEYVVLAPHVEGSLGALIEIRKNASNVADVLGSEQISKSGDSDAAASLKRVTGLTLVDGKYIYVRGLGERYSQTLLNGSTLPSPDPARRVVPLDMFPSGIIKNLVIQKSYTPDRPGEFGGGAILLETKTIPEEFFLKISTSLKYMPDDSGSSQFTYAGGAKDWQGRDDGTRALPAPIASAIQGGQRLDECNLVVTTGCFTPEQLTQFSKEMKRNYRTYERKETAPPSMSVAMGDRFKSGKFSAGILSSLRYSQEWDSESKIKRSYNLGNSQTGELTLDKSSQRESSEREIDVGGTLDFGVEYGKEHTISLGGLLVRKTTDTTEVSTGYDSDQTNLVFRDNKLKWTERELSTYSVKGAHTLTAIGGIGFDWRVTKAKATLDEPDQREYRYYDDGSGYQFETRGDGNRRIYSNLEDNNSDIGLDLKVPFGWFGRDGLVKMGYNAIRKDRNSQIRRFKYEEQIAGSLAPELLKEELDTIFADENLGKDGFLLKEDTQPTDNYTADQEINATYAMVEMPLFSWIRIISGMRYEKSKQDVKTFKLFDPDNNPDIAALETVDYLPVHSATIFLTPKMQIRAAYSETLSRPDFKELSTAPYHDVENDRIVVGNNNLVGSVIKNIDVRWEWYFERSENISLGIFQKHFDTPIEAVARNSTEGGITFKNALEAKNLGAEVEFRKNFGFISGFLRDLSLAGNYSWIDSEVTISPQDAGLLTSTTRALQGQSPYVINAQILYENKDRGTDIGLLYNIFGKRITEVGVLGMPDVYEQPFSQLDLVVGQKLSSHFAVNFKANNIINPEAKQLQGDQLVQLYRKGRSFSLGLSGSF